MKVSTPLGEYPFEFRRIERRGRSVVIVGTVAGLQSSVVLGAEDLRAAARRLGPVPAPLVILALLWRARSARLSRAA